MYEKAIIQFLARFSEAQGVQSSIHNVIALSEHVVLSPKSKSLQKNILKKLFKSNLAYRS